MSPFFRLDYLTDPNWAHYCIWFHCVLAVFIFAAIYYLLPEVISAQAELPILKQADKISYEVYLVHHPLILGPLALLSITPFTGLNIAVALLTTIALAYVCKYVCMMCDV
jgi:peptidoglycan/LPS O-acetylase OafA/YrhL